MEDNRFEKLEVWKKAHQLVLKIHKLTKSFPKEEKYSLVDQLRRASASIAANIVEGNERKTRKEFNQFLYVAKGSLAETKYFLILSRDLFYINKVDSDTIIQEANEIGKMINGLISYLKK